MILKTLKTLINKHHNRFDYRRTDYEAWARKLGYQRVSITGKKNNHQYWTKHDPNNPTWVKLYTLEAIIEKEIINLVDKALKEQLDNG